MLNKLLFVILITLISFLNSQQSFADVEAKLQKESEKEPFLVQVINSTVQEKAGAVYVFGITQHVRKINLKAETAGRIEEILVKEGEMVKKGDVIAKIAIGNRNQTLRKSQAELSKRELEYKVAKSLLKSGHRSETKLAEALANLRFAKADLSQIKLDIKYTQIVAPFDGIAQELMVEIGDIVKKNETNIALIIDYSSSLAIAYIPEQKINMVNIGDIALIEATGFLNAKKGLISYISQVADTATRTFKVEIKVPFDGNVIKEGLTTKIAIPTKSFKAHLISSSYLSLNEKGDIGIKTIDENNIVKFSKVKIIDQNAQGMLKYL